MAIEFSSIAGCGDTKMTYLRIMCEKNNIKVRIMSDISKQDTISCRFQKGTTELCLELPSNDFLSDVQATERRLTMLVCWAFKIRVSSDDSARMIFQALRNAQEGGTNGKKQ